MLCLLIWYPVLHKLNIEITLFETVFPNSIRGKVEWTKGTRTLLPGSPASDYVVEDFANVLVHAIVWQVLCSVFDFH